MGISLSKRQQQHHQPPPPSLPQLPPPPPPPQQPSSSSVPPPPPLSSHAPPPNPSFAYGANAPYSAPSQNPYCLIPAPYPPQSNGQFNYGYNYPNRPVIYHSSYHPPYYLPNAWSGYRPPQHVPLPLPAVPYVDHQNAKKIKNDINVHKDTIKLQVDDNNKDCHLVSFVFDALVDGSISIFYFAKGGTDCTYTPVYTEIKPVRVPFQKGLGQKFCQPSGTGVDLGFFDINDLSKPIPGENAFPLVIVAESCASTSADEQPNEQQANKLSNAQITEAIIEKNNEDHFQVKVIKQILWVEGVRYELREIYGISKPDEAAISDDSGKECVICMTEPKDTAVLPCRHMVRLSFSFLQFFLLVISLKKICHIMSLRCRNVIARIPLLMLLYRCPFFFASLSLLDILDDNL
nr:probable E3 ubiquitin-protein ligase LUL4 [Ipomoea batatas]